jgi:hypothetical protein
LKTVTLPDGGFAYQPGGQTPSVGDANSTALAIQALVAVGEDPNSTAWGHPLDVLARFQKANGAFRYRDDAPNDNTLAAVQALPALMAKALPISPSSGFGQADVATI